LYLDGEISSDAFGKFFRPIEQRQKQLEDELPKLQAEIDFLKVNSFSSDQVMNDAVYLQESWPALDRTEKRKIVECITNKIVISKEEITIDLCYLPSSKELSKRNWSLGGPFPFCHLRLKSARNLRAKR
jgi:site-specific DNA recombinase